MVDLKYLNVSGNPRLEYDCGLRTMWILCYKKNNTCVTDVEHSFQMVNNLHCDVQYCGHSDDAGVFRSSRNVAIVTNFKTICILPLSTENWFECGTSGTRKSRLTHLLYDVIQSLHSCF
jgi:hypothetical protein